MQRNKNKGEIKLEARKRLIKDVIGAIHELGSVENQFNNTFDDSNIVKSIDESKKGVIDAISKIGSKFTDNVKTLTYTIEKKSVSFNSGNTVKDEVVKRNNISNDKPKLQSKDDIKTRIKDFGKNLLVSTAPELVALKSTVDNVKTFVSDAKKTVIGDNSDELNEINKKLDTQLEYNKDVVKLSEKQLLVQEENRIDDLREKKRNKTKLLNSTISSSNIIKNSETDSDGFDIFDIFGDDKKGNKRHRKGGLLKRVLGKGKTLGKGLLGLGSMLPGVAGASEGVGGIASGALGIAGKALPWVAAATAAYSGYKGWNQAGEIFNTDNATTGQKVSSAAGNIVDTFTGGLIDKETASKFLYKLGTDVSDSVTSIAKFGMDSLSNITSTIGDSLSNGFDSVKSFFGFGDKKSDIKSKNGNDSILKTAMNLTPIGMVSNLISGDSVSNGIDSVKSFFGFGDTNETDKNVIGKNDNVNKIGLNNTTSVSYPIGDVMNKRSIEYSNRNQELNKDSDNKETTNMYQPITNNYYYVNDENNGKKGIV